MIAGVKLSQDGQPQCFPEELVEHIVIELTLMQDIERKLQLLSEERQMLAEEHVKHLDEIDYSVKETIGRCPHHATTFRQGVPGGSPTCDTCGKEL
jgi:hypothetical protein